MDAVQTKGALEFLSGANSPLKPQSSPALSRGRHEPSAFSRLLAQTTQRPRDRAQSQSSPSQPNRPVPDSAPPPPDSANPSEKPELQPEKSRKPARTGETEEIHQDSISSATASIKTETAPAATVESGDINTLDLEAGFETPDTDSLVVSDLGEAGPSLPDGVSESKTQPTLGSPTVNGTHTALEPTGDTDRIPSVTSGEFPTNHVAYRNSANTHQLPIADLTSDNEHSLDEPEILHAEGDDSGLHFSLKPQAQSVAQPPQLEAPNPNPGGVLGADQFRDSNVRNHSPGTGQNLTVASPSDGGIHQLSGSISEESQFSTDSASSPSSTSSEGVESSTNPTLSQPKAQPNSSTGPSKTSINLGHSPAEAPQAEHLVDRIGTSVLEAAQGRNVLRMRMHPPELGVLQIEVTSHEGVLTARLDVDNAKAHQAVFENLPQLQEMLQKANAQIARIDLHLLDSPENAPDQFGQAGQHGPQGQQSSQSNSGQQAPNSPERNPGIETHSETKGQQQTSRHNKNTTLSGIDIQA